MTKDRRRAIFWLRLLHVPLVVSLLLCAASLFRPEFVFASGTAGPGRHWEWTQRRIRLEDWRVKPSGGYATVYAADGDPSLPFDWGFLGSWSFPPAPRVLTGDWYELHPRACAAYGGGLSLLVLAIEVVLRLRRPYVPGLCPKCGYDLRATPDRCPECGQRNG